MTGAGRSKSDRSAGAGRILLAVLLMATLCGPLLAAGNRRGSTVSIKMKDGTLAYGELVRIEPDLLVLSAGHPPREREIAVGEIASISVFGVRRLEPRALNGAAAGVFLGLIGSSSFRDRHDDHAPTLWPALLGAGGFFAGLALEFVGETSEVVSFAGLPATVQTSTLRGLARYSREDRAGRGDWLGGFRVSLRPYFHPPLPIRLDGAASFPEPFSSTMTEAIHRKDQSYPNRLGRVRLDYELRPWLFLGFEFVSLGGHRIGAGDYPRVVSDGQDYVSGLFTSGYADASAALLGVSLGAASGPRAELGAGLAFSSLTEFGPEDGSPWTGDVAGSSRLKASPVLQLGASWEFSPGEPISGGVFAGYMVLRPATPALTYRGSLAFYPGTELSTDRPVAFRLDSELTYPAQHIDLSGLSFGVFIRFR